MNAVLAVFAAIGGLGGLGGLGALFYVTSTRRKLDAEARKIGVDANDVISGRALEMYDRAIKEAGEAKAEARSCHAELSALKDHVDRLERLMLNANLDPPEFRWPPLYQSEGV